MNGNPTIKNVAIFNGVFSIHKTTITIADVIIKGIKTALLRINGLGGCFPLSSL